MNIKICLVILLALSWSATVSSSNSLLGENCSFSQVDRDILENNLTKEAIENITDNNTKELVQQRRRQTEGRDVPPSDDIGFGEDDTLFLFAIDSTQLMAKTLQIY